MGDANTEHRLGGGYVYIAPTDLGAGAPYGGTRLGLVQAVALKYSLEGAPVTAEEYGGEVVEEIHQVQEVSVSMVMRGWDRDALAAVFPGVSFSAGGDPVIQSPTAAFEPGDLMTSRGQKLLLVPEDPASPGWILYRAIPYPEASGVVEFSHVRGLSFLATFHGLRDVAGRTIRIAKLGDLVL